MVNLKHRYTVQYSTDRQYSYAVCDGDTGNYVFGSHAKSECIAEAQRLNGFKIDGDEQSYAKQIGWDK